MDRPQVTVEDVYSLHRSTLYEAVLVIDRVYCRTYYPETSMAVVRKELALTDPAYYIVAYAEDLHDFCDGELSLALARQFAEAATGDIRPDWNEGN